jgi:hypothetical protein
MPPEVLALATELGIARVLDKPVDGADLLDFINNALARFRVEP